MIVVAYVRGEHAAHAEGGGGWDLEQWDVRGVERHEDVKSVVGKPAAQAEHGDVPLDAEYHHGYRDAEGRQHWVFVRSAPLSPGRCPRCPREK